MKRLTWGSIVLCIFASASLAADPDAAGTSNSAGGASKGAVGTGKISKFSGVVVTAGGLAVLTAAVIAASAGSGNGATTTNH
jgi:hypothetical protein